MDMFQEEQGVKVYYSKVKSIHNPAPLPVVEMHLVCRVGCNPDLHVAFMGEPSALKTLSAYVQERKLELCKLGVMACCGPNATLRLRAPVVFEEGIGVLICTMMCVEPKRYDGTTAIAHLLKKVGVRLGTPCIPFPQLFDSIPPNSFLARAD